MEISLYSPATVLCICVVVFISSLYTYVTWTFSYWKRRGVKCMEPLALIGNYDKFILGKVNRSVVVDTLYKKNAGERFFGICHFRTPVLILRDPTLINKILTTDFDHFEDRIGTSGSVTIFDSWLTLTFKKWKSDKNKLTHLLVPETLESMFEKMESSLTYLNKVLEPNVVSGNEIEMCEVIKKFTMNFIMSVTFGFRCNLFGDSDDERIGEGSELFRFSMRSVLDTLLNSMDTELIKNVENMLGINIIPNHVQDFYLKFIKELVVYREKNNIQRNDFLQLLINLNKEDQEKKRAPASFPNSDIAFEEDSLLASNLLIFYKAGFKTITFTLSICLLELADNLDIQRMLREEILKLKTTNNNQLSYSTLKKMKYMDKVISETLRKYPVAMGLLRHCTKSYQIPETDVIIEEGIPIYIPVHSIQRDPEYYPNSETFDPERFTEENIADRLVGTYLPFGEGPRQCIGANFALLHMKSALAHILSRYKVSMTTKTTLPLEFSCKSAFLAPKDGIWLKVTRL